MPRRPGRLICPHGARKRGTTNVGFGSHSGDGVGLPGGPQTSRTSKTQLDVWADQAADYVIQGVRA